jgi:hypothetical protein
MVSHWLRRTILSTEEMALGLMQHRVAFEVKVRMVISSVERAACQT